MSTADYYCQLDSGVDFAFDSELNSGLDFELHFANYVDSERPLASVEVLVVVAVAVAVAQQKAAASEPAITNVAE